MTAELLQDKRFGKLETNLGPDKLVLARFEGQEAMSDLYSFSISAVSKEHNIDFDKMLGTNCDVSIASGYEGVDRHFNGILVEAAWVEKLRNFRFTD